MKVRAASFRRVITAKAEVEAVRLTSSQQNIVQARVTPELSSADFMEAKWRVKDARQRLGDFAYEMFKQQGMLPFAFKVLSDVRFTEAEALFLANNAPLPVLAKLIALVRPTATQTEIFLRPVCFLPLGALLEEKGKEGALATCRTYLEQLAKDLAVPQPVCLAIDRWQGTFAFENLLDVLSEVARMSFVELTFRALGPSSAELKQLLGGKENLREEVVKLLDLLQAHGVASIDGGGDLELHHIGAERSFLSSVGQLVALPRGMSALAEASQEGGNYKWFDEGFIRGLEAFRDLSEQHHEFQVWFPWSLGSLDRMENLAGQPLGLQLLRAIALGRLMLPKLPFIRAPLSLLGVKLAHVALEFGANDLGFAAVDARTADSLGLAPLSGIVEIMEKRNAFLKVLA